MTPTPVSFFVTLWRPIEGKPTEFVFTVEARVTPPTPQRFNQAAGGEPGDAGEVNVEKVIGCAGEIPWAEFSAVLTDIEFDGLRYTACEEATIADLGDVDGGDR